MSPLALLLLIVPFVETCLNVQTLDLSCPCDLYAVDTFNGEHLFTTLGNQSFAEKHWYYWYGFLSPVSGLPHITNATSCVRKIDCGPNPALTLDLLNLDEEWEKDITLSNHTVEAQCFNGEWQVPGFERFDGRSPLFALCFTSETGCRDCGIYPYVNVDFLQSIIRNTPAWSESLRSRNFSISNVVQTYHRKDENGCMHQLYCVEKAYRMEVFDMVGVWHFAMDRTGPGSLSIAVKCLHPDVHDPIVEITNLRTGDKVITDFGAVAVCLGPAS